MKIKVQKFVVFPVISVYTDDGDLLKEDKLKPFIVYPAEEVSLKKTAKLIEIDINAKVAQTQRRGFGKNNGNHKKISIPNSRPIRNSSGSRVGQQGSSLRDVKNPF